MQRRHWLLVGVALFSGLGGCAATTRQVVPLGFTRHSLSTSRFGEVRTDSSDWEIELDGREAPYAADAGGTGEKYLNFKIKRVGATSEPYSRVLITFTPSKLYESEELYRVMNCGREESMGYAEGENELHKNGIREVIMVPNDEPTHECSIQIGLEIPLFN